MAQAPAGLKPGGVFLTPRVELTARCFSVFPAITVGIKVHIIDAAGVSLVTVCMAKSRIVHAGSDETADTGRGLSVLFLDGIFDGIAKRAIEIYD
jgi:hypothetical protein